MELKHLSEAVMQRWKTKEVHDTDFYGFTLGSRRINTILDIGANLGQSIISFRILFPEATIHSYEANPILIGKLNSLASEVPGNIEINPYGLADKGGSFYLNIPYSNGEAFIEEASITDSYYELPWVKQKFLERGGLTRLEKVKCDLRVGDELKLSPDLIKVDVEGAESMVLRGLKRTIERSKPIIMVENSDWHNVSTIMKSLGYVARRYDHDENKLLPMNGPTTNTFYIYHGLSLTDSIKKLLFLK